MTIGRLSAPPPGLRRTSYAGLAALEAGDGPTALLLPGFTGSKEDFLPLLAPLDREGFRAVAVDQRGQHESVGPDDPDAYTVDGLAADVLAVVDALGGEPVHLLGHSFGGLVARAAVLADGGVAASLTLLGSGPAAIVGPRGAALRAMRLVFARGGLPAVWAAIRAADDRQLDADELAFLQRRFFASSPVALATMGEELLAAPDRVAELAAVGLPLLVAHGAGDDAWPPRLQAEMARRLGARYAVIPEALHSPAAEAPAATLDVLAAFWREVEQHRAA